MEQKKKFKIPTFNIPLYVVHIEEIPQKGSHPLDVKA